MNQSENFNLIERNNSEDEYEKDPPSEILTDILIK